MPNILATGAALVPALFVLVSMCGSPVPAPPGSVSGAVYFDSNHNRLHDICDKPLSATISLTTADRKTLTAIPTANGAFHFADVPAGEALLTLTSEGDLFWPMTQRTADNRAGVAVSVKSQEDTAGVEIASISSMALPQSSDSVTGVIYLDSNGNGQVDVDECGLAHAGVYPQSDSSGPDGGSFSVGGFVSQPGDGTFSMTAANATGTIFASLPAGPWTSTTVPPGVNPCVDGVKAVLASDANVYEAVIGYRESPAHGTITGILFDDANADGHRDEGEGGVASVAVFMQPTDNLCGATVSSLEYTDSNGEFTIYNLVPGHYEPVIGGDNTGVSGLISKAWPSSTNLAATANASPPVSLPVRVQPSGQINLSVFNDVDGDGTRDVEDATANVGVCIYPVDDSGGIYYETLPLSLPSPCTMTYDGYGSFGPLPLGTYRLVVGEKWWPQPITQDVVLSGSQAFANIGLPPPQPVSIPILNGTPVPIDVCYSDQGWVQPSFDKRYNGTEFLYAQWGIDEVEARRIYNVGFYSSGQEAEVWTHIAGIPWKISPKCPGINEGVYEIVGFEPLSAVRAGYVIQITVRPMQGLYVMRAPLWSMSAGDGPYFQPSIDGSSLYEIGYGDPTVVFVDESTNLIARCVVPPNGPTCERLD